MPQVEFSLPIRIQFRMAGPPPRDPASVVSCYATWLFTLEPFSRASAASEIQTALERGFAPFYYNFDAEHISDFVTCWRVFHKHHLAKSGHSGGMRSDQGKGRTVELRGLRLRIDVYGSDTMRLVPVASWSNPAQQRRTAARIQTDGYSSTTRSVPRSRSSEENR